MLAMHGDQRGAVSERAWERGGWLTTLEDRKSMQRSQLVKEEARQPVE